MPEYNKIDDGYDTSINIFGGLKDCNVIYKAVDSYFNPNDTLKNLIFDRNEFNLRTERSRIRIERAIRTVFLRFVNGDHRDLIQAIFTNDATRADRELIVYWQLAMNNRLFREISSKVFLKTYFSGRTGLTKDDVVAYLKEFLSHSKHLNLKWSESTISTLASKYLNLMTNLNFLEGIRVKSFRLIKPSAEAMVLFLYFAQLHAPDNHNILNNEMLPFSFVAAEDIQERLKKLSMKGYFNMNFNGVALNVELIHSYKGVCRVLYNRP